MAQTHEEFLYSTLNPHFPEQIDSLIFPPENKRLLTTIKRPFYLIIERANLKPGNIVTKLVGLIR